MATLDYKQSDAGYTLKNGDYVTVSDLDGIAQMVKVYLLFGKTEDPVDQERGTPWNQILGEKLTDDQLKQYLADRILSVPGVTDIIEIEIIKKDRKRFAEFTARTDAGLLNRINLPLVGGF